MASERLDIVISETGSTAVASAMRDIATAVEGAGSSLAFLKKALKDLKVGDVKTSLDAVAASTGKLGTKAKQTGVKVQNFTKTMGHLNSTNKAVVKSSGDSEKAIKDLKRAFTRVAPAARGAGAAAQAAGAQAKIGAHGFGSMTRQVFILKSTFATLGGLALARGILSMSDAYQNLGNRLRLVTKNTEQLSSTRKQLFAVAKKTRQAIGATAETYVRLRKATQSLEITDQKVMSTLTTINRLLALSGASANETSQSMLQLSQAFSKGKLDGDEFKSVAENMPDIIDALAKSLGVAKREIRDMAASGLLTSKVLVQAFSDVGDEVEQNLKNSVVTLGQAWQNLKTSALEAVGAFNNQTGSANALVKAIQWLSENFGVVVTAMKLMTILLGTKLVLATLRWSTALKKQLITDAIPKLIKGLTALRNAGFLFSMGPVGLAIGATAIAATAAVLTYKALKSEAKSYKGEQTKGEAALQKELSKHNRELKTLKQAQESGHYANLIGIKQSIKARQLQKTVILDVLDALRLARLEGDKATAKDDRQAEASAALNELIALHAKKNQALDESKAAHKILRTAYNEQVITAEQLFEIEGNISQILDKQKFPVKALLAAAKAEIDFAKKTNKQKIVSLALTKAEAAIKQSVGDYTFVENGPDVKAQVKELAALYEQLGRIAGRRKSSTKAATKAKKAAREEATRIKELATNYRSVISVIDPLLEAQHKYADNLVQITTLESYAKLTQEQSAAARAHQTKQLDDALNPQKAIIKGLHEELSLLKLLPEARAKEARMRELKNKFESAGQSVAKADSNAQEVYRLEQELAAKAALRSATDAVAESTRKAAQAMADADLILANGGTRLEHREAVLAAISMRSSEHAAAVGKVTESMSKQVPVADQLNQQIAVWSELAAHGGVNAEVLTTKIAALKQKMDESKQSTTGWAAAMRSLEESTFSAEAVQSQFASAVSGVYQNMEDTMVKFATGQKVVWKDMVDAMIADFMRLLVRMAVMKTVSAIAGAPTVPGLAARHGMNKHVGADLPRFAHGGSMHVGGSGGPDSKLVQFMASPGERVQVTNPGQSRLDSRNQAPAAPPAVNITNVVDPSEFAAALSSPAGERAIINVVESNADLFRRFLK